jgi:general secretion pathway protein H
MVSPGAMPKMPILALGNPERVARAMCHQAGAAGRGRAAHGFTLLELLLVLALVALTSAGASFALRDSADTQLQQEAQRLAALLETARAQARANGVPVLWQPQPGGFKLNGHTRTWLHPNTIVTRLSPHPKSPAPPEPALWLPPEPLMPPQRLRLSVDGHEVWLGTNGVTPWRVLEQADAAL